MAKKWLRLNDVQPNSSSFLFYCRKMTIGMAARPTVLSYPSL